MNYAVNPKHPRRRTPLGRCLDNATRAAMRAGIPLHETGPVRARARQRFAAFMERQARAARRAREGRS